MNPLQALARRLRQPEQGHQLGQGPPQAHAGEEPIHSKCGPCGKLIEIKDECKISHPHHCSKEGNCQILMSPMLMQEQIYWSIKEEPFKIPDETYDDLMYTFFSPEKEGWLLKEGGG